VSTCTLPGAVREGSLQVDPYPHEILWPTDLSPESRPALDHVRALADRFSAQVTLYHAVPRPDLEYQPWPRGGSMDGYWSAAADAAHLQLAELAESLATRHTVCVEKVISPARAIVSWIRANRPDLVVMATHGHSGLSQLLLGSVTQQVIQHARRPVLGMRHAVGGRGLPYRRLLVPTDLSPASRSAFGHAGAIARVFGAQVIGLYVAPPEPDRAADAQASLERLMHDRLPGVHMTARVDHGRPWERIVAQAIAADADLVVMSCQGADAVEERLLGSNTDRVLRQAPCPVLVV
jgi:nucleotide-binding universal stress UspA family protein